MGSFTDYAENSCLKHLSKEAAYTPVATIYMALCTSSPGDTATGASMNEVANSGSYARTAITFGGAAASRRITPTATTTFTAATGSWGTVTHWAYVDNATYGSGNVLAYGALGTSRAVVSGNTPSIAASETYCEFIASNGISNYFANGFLDRMFRNQALTIAANYIALVTVIPTDSSTGTSITEPSGNGYARTVINASGGASPAWNAVASGSLTNNQTVTLPSPSGAGWGACVYMCLVDASTVGNLLAYGDIVDQTILGTDPAPTFSSSGGITVTMS